MHYTQNEILRDTYKNLTLVEDMHKIKEFIVKRSQLDKTKTTADHDNLFSEYKNKIQDPDFKTALSNYYQDSKTATKALFSFTDNQKTILTNHLINLHFINARVLAGGDQIFASRIVNEKHMKDMYPLLADDLLKGRLDPSTTLAAQAATKIKHDIQLVDAEMANLKQSNTTLANKVQQLTKQLVTLVNNVKQRFGLAESEIEAMKTIQTLKPESTPTNRLSNTQTEKPKPQINL